MADAKTCSTVVSGWAAGARAASEDAAAAVEPSVAAPAASCASPGNMQWLRHAPSHCCGAVHSAAGAVLQAVRLSQCLARQEQS